MEKFTVLDLLKLDLKEHDALNLKCIEGRAGLTREITVPELDRPGLALTGFFDKFANKRIQVFGRGENAYLNKLEKERKTENLEKMFGCGFPCAIFTYGFEPIPSFLELAKKTQCPILQTDLSSSEFSARILRVLSGIFAPHITIHGVLVEVFGIGVLIKGESGVGKSETALALIERQHRLVADDVVQIRCVSGNFLLGKGGNAVTSHHMEIRGLGIINIAHLFGVGAIRDEKRVQMVIELEDWDSSKAYDRIGVGEKTIDILGVKVPYLVVPIKPGRNIAIIIETAAMNERLKKMGYNPEKEFNKNVMNWLERQRAETTYDTVL
ncbi:MAG TPA: HPr(Ser) kinase/phosphatase [Spirochaetia bacterium]|nr:HPr(Ser) kinase/phosphatase [Spirochaetia bacterium]